MSIQSIELEHKCYGYPPDDGVGGRLQEARKRAGLTLDATCEQLPEDLGINTRSTLNNLEHGRGRLRVDQLLALCRIYDASPLWVLTKFGPERWSDLPRWIERPEKYALQAAVERFALEVAEAGRAAGVAESVADYWAEAGKALQEDSE